jgi:hypothetical protein
MDEAQQVPSQNQITPVPPITTYPTPQLTPTSKTPWILISLIIILLGVASYFGYQTYQLTQQLANKVSIPNPSPVLEDSPFPSTVSFPKDWILFADDQLNVTFRFPASYKLIPANKDNNYVSLIKPGGEVEGTGAFSHYKIFVSNSTKQTIDEAIAESKNNSWNLFGSDIEYTSIEQISVGEAIGKTFSYPGYGYEQDIFVINPSTSKVLSLVVIYANKEVRNNEKDEVNQILSTFNFGK